MDSYRELVAWQRAMALCMEVYAVTRRFPREEQFGLTSQLRRAAVAIPSNIAEGHDRRAGTSEFAHFLGIARGSLAECETQLLIAQGLGYCDGNALVRTWELTSETGRLIGGLLRAMESKTRSRARPAED